MLAVIGALASAAVTASAFVPGAPRLPGWPAQIALMVGVLLFAAMTVREHGGFPDRRTQRQIWAAWRKSLPAWMRTLMYAINWGCVLLSVYTFFTATTDTHMTGEQFNGYTGPIALAVNVSVLVYASARRREASV